MSVDHFNSRLCNNSQPISSIDGLRFRSTIFKVKDQHQIPDKVPKRHLSTDVSRSFISSIKGHTPQLRLTTDPVQRRQSPEERGWLFFGSQVKKREDIVKKVVERLKKQKNKEYTRLTRKRQTLLPLLNLEGRRYIDPFNSKRQPQRKPYKADLAEESRPLKLRRDIQLSPQQLQMSREPGESISGWRRPSRASRVEECHFSLQPL